MDGEFKQEAAVLGQGLNDTSLDFGSFIYKVKGLDPVISKVSFSWTKSTGVLRHPLPGLQGLGHLLAFLFLPGSHPKEGATVSTSSGTELEAPPKGGDFGEAAANFKWRPLLPEVGEAPGSSEPGGPHLSGGSRATAPPAPTAAAGLSLVPRRSGVLVSGATET